jgi:hypothetical protein
LVGYFYGLIKATEDYKVKWRKYIL